MDTRRYTIQYGRSSQFTVVVQEEELAALVEADLVEIKPNMLNRTENAILKFLVERPDKAGEAQQAVPSDRAGDESLPAAD